MAVVMGERSTTVAAVMIMGPFPFVAAAARKPTIVWVLRVARQAVDLIRPARRRRVVRVAEAWRRKVEVRAERHGELVGRAVDGERAPRHRGVGAGADEAFAVALHALQGELVRQVEGRGTALRQGSHGEEEEQEARPHRQLQMWV